MQTGVLACADATAHAQAQCRKGSSSHECYSKVATERAESHDVLYRALVVVVS